MAKLVAPERPVLAREDVLARLAELGCESDRVQLRSWLGLAGAPAGAKPSFARASTGPWSWAFRGRVLSAQGRLDEALPWLSRAEEALPREPAVAAWRGELLFLFGNRAEAMRSLDACLGLSPRYPWACVYRAAVKFSAGDVDGAGRDLDEFSRLFPRSPVAGALRSILDAQRGDHARAEKNLARALKLGPCDWIYALRATMLARGNDLHGARRDFDASLRLGDSPWARFQRAAITNRMGDFKAALKDLKAVARRLPASPEPHAKAAAIYLDQAQYTRAVASLTRALALAPGDPSLHRARGRLYFVQSRLAEAQKDVEEACRLAPGDHYLKQERIQLLIIRGFTKEATASLESETFSPGIKEFWLGYIACRRKSYADASDCFARAARLAESSSLDIAAKARFYGAVSRVLRGLPRRAPAPSKELSLIGLGYRHPFQLSVGALEALSASEVIYSNLSDPKVTDFLGLFDVPFNVIVYRGLMIQATNSARIVIKGFKRYQRIAMVTRGQPIIYGRLAYHLYKGAEKNGIPCRVPASVSIFDTILSLAPQESVVPNGLQVLDMARLADLDARTPAVIYLPLVAGSPDRVLRTLKRLYPGTHTCHVLPGAGDNEYNLTSAPLAGLGELLKRSDPACTLYVPAREA